MLPEQIDSGLLSADAVVISKGTKLRAFWNGERIVRLGLLVFSIFYFTDVFLRASAKYFWADEILTVYFSRFSSLAQLWGALQSGIENNLPAFHVLTHASETIFGENLIGTRMPEIVSFWLLCLCLFYFVRRRAGAGAGFVAMMLPMLTGAYFYAYEARPLIILAALAGAALLCWDNAMGSGAPTRGHAGRWQWLVGFSFCLFAALMLHCYGLLLLIPFASVELYRTIKSRRLDWRVWAYLTFPLFPTFFLYLPMLRFFRGVAEGTEFPLYFPANWPAVSKVYSFLFTPCLAVLLLLMILVAHSRYSRRVDIESQHPIRLSWEDTLLCVGFTALPVFGVILGQIAHSPYFERYFLSAVLGFCIPFGVIAGTIRSNRYSLPFLLAVIAAALCLNFGRLVRHRLEGSGETLIEPSTKTELSTTVGNPLLFHPLIRYKTSNGSEPIAVLDPSDFVYLLQYAPRLATRLYYVHPSRRDMFLRASEIFRPWCPVKYNPALTGPQFTAHFKTFYLYSDRNNVEMFYQMCHIARILDFWGRGDHYLARMETK